MHEVIHCSEQLMGLTQGMKKVLLALMLKYLSFILMIPYELRERPLFRPITNAFNDEYRVDKTKKEQLEKIFPWFRQDCKSFCST